jgi:L-lactate dehydrogenase complex protein LldG
MPRDYVLHKVRTALGRSVGQAPEPAPPPDLRIPEVSLEDRITDFRTKLELLAGRTEFVTSAADAADYVARVVDGRDAVASNAPFLAECGITALPGVRSGWTDGTALRAACATAPVGITSADYALADTGTLVMIAGPSEARMVSLLPPLHIAVIPVDRILTGLDELLMVIPDPAKITSSMVLITGPSRTADIEQILVRGVHGPGEIHVVIVGR